MTFFDRLFRFKKKPFGESGKETKGDKAGKIPDTSASAGSPEKGSGKFSHILLRPHTSEKAVSSQAQNQYTFEVAPSTSKIEVARAVRDLYGIKPLKVAVLNVSGKRIRFGRTAGETKSWKKAVITLPPGKTIDVYKR